MISCPLFHFGIFTIPIFKTPMFQLLFKRNTSGEYITSHISLYQTILETIKLWVEIFFKASSCHNWVWSFLQDSIVNYGNGGTIYSCGLNCVVLIVFLILLCCWYCCAIDSVCLLLVRIIPQLCWILKLEHTWQQIWNVT